jgi:hypothetical protein
LSAFSAFVSADSGVCKLNKSLYGLKQAPRVWYETLCEFLSGLGFKRLIKDRCVFVGIFDGDLCYIAVYVDDLLIMASTLKTIKYIKSALHNRFQMSDLGEAAFLLGWSIVRNRSTRTISLYQTKYAQTILERFNHSNANPVAMPLDPSVRLSKEMEPKTPHDIEQMSKVPYREAVGSLCTS